MANLSQNTGIVVLGIFSIFFPVLLLPFSLLLFRKSHKAAMFCFILFAFYFGWFYPLQLDLLVHYENFVRVAKFSFFKLYKDPETLYLGKELYPILFKFIVGKISIEPAFFSAIACSLYASAFMFFMRAFRKDYIKPMTTLQYILLVALFGIVEYYWFLGLRYWTGFFVFIGFYTRYLRDNNPKYLIFSLSCLLFHFAHLAIVLALLLEYILRKRLYVIYLLAAVGLVVRFLDWDIPSLIVPYVSKYGVLNISYTDQSIAESTREYTQEYREVQNLVYAWRNEILFFVGIVTARLLYRKTRDISLVENNLWRISWLVYAIANFSFASIVLNDRLTKVACVLLYTCLWCFVSRFAAQRKTPISIPPFALLFLGVCVLFGFLTTLVSQRESLLSLSLWFNNWFL